LTKKPEKMAKDDLIICRLIARKVTDNDLKMKMVILFRPESP